MSDPNPQSPAPNPQKAIAILPARYASTRLPGKPLLADTGKPLIQHVVERVQQAQRIGRIIVATDDTRIADTVRAFDGEVIMTRADHPNGTSRLAEVVGGLNSEACGLKGEPENLKPDALIINVQGDEPEIDPQVIDALVDAMAADPDAPMGTVAAPLDDPQEIANPNVVKAVLDQRGRAIYFSRSAIPHNRDGDAGVEYLRHLGIYAYRAGFLPVYAGLSPTPLEQAEKLEQLRVIEHGHAIVCIRAAQGHPGIDTPKQYAAFVKRHRA